MSEDEILFAAAREVRPFLRDLVGSESDAIDTSLARALLSSEADELRLDQIDGAFRGNDALVAWLAQFVAGGATPPEVRGTVVRGGHFSGLAGDPSPLSGARFACPKGDYVFYALRRGESIEPCPTHGLALVRADGPC
jgi:hypothetical protein